MENILTHKQKGKRKKSESSTTEKSRTQKETEVDVPSTSKDKASLEGCLTEEEMMTISKMVNVDQHTELAIQLNVDQQTRQHIEKTCSMNQLHFSEIVFRILKDWMQRNGKEATRCRLKSVLLKIQRKDIADKVFRNLPESDEKKQMQKQYKGTQNKMEDGQRERYVKIELPQVNWTKRTLPLEELYVNLELVTSSDEGNESEGREIQLEELFLEINGKEPVRILIEGGPGFGKTTLCLKLISDWGQKKDYINSKFKLVFIFELRYFEENDSIESVLKRECEAVGVDGDEGIRCIEAFEEETLLILDGFDEMSEECKRKFLPLFQKNVYRSMFVLVTSRRGFFQVEIQKGSKCVGLLEKKNNIENVVDVWGKRVLIKGVTTDKTETFMRKYLQKDYQELKGKINSIIGGEMREVFQCPLFLILLAMLLEERKHVKVNTKTTLYKEFFNFVVRRNLIREKKLSDEEEVDIFDGSDEHSIVQLVDLFGQFALECLLESKLFFRENEILKYCNDEMVLKLGFLTKIPKMKVWKRENFYQPIHRTFLEFAAAFATWNLFKRDEHEFKKEMEQIGEKGLKPTDDSLFFVFLGGLMNSQASVLFQSLIHHSLWFNIENICFSNILLEIQDIPSFFPSFEPILDSFIPSLYSINSDKGLRRDYFLSDIHSLILKHSSDRQLIKVLDWNLNFSINLSGELYFDCLKISLTDQLIKPFSKENGIRINDIKILYKLTHSFTTNQWNDFVSLFNSIQSEKVHFFFADQLDAMNSNVLNLLHKELVEGRWKQKNIDRLRFQLNEKDDPDSLSLLVDLVKKNRINEGIYLKIDVRKDRNENETNLLKRKTEEIFNSIFQSKTIQEFVFKNFHLFLSLDIDMNEILNSQLKRFKFDGSVNILKPNKNETENYSLEEVNLVSDNNNNDFNFIQYFQRIKYLNCSIDTFNYLVEMEWPGLKVMEELELVNFKWESHHLYLTSFSQLINLQVLSLDFSFIKTISSNSDRIVFVHFFSSLRLRICEFKWIHHLESFSFLTETLMEGMKKKEENNPTLDSNERKKVYLEELVIGVGLCELRECKGIESIQTMLRNQHLKQCCFIGSYLTNFINPEVVETLFPTKNNFRIIREVNGMNPNGSRRSQFEYRWLVKEDKYYIKYVE